MHHASVDWVRTGLLVLSLLIGAGVVLGSTGRITVFRDRTDIFATFSLVIGSGLAFYLLYPMTQSLLSEIQTLGKVGVFGLVAFLLSLVIARSWTDNESIGKTALAVMTKAPFAVLVPVLILKAAAPTGRRASDRASARFLALAALMFLAPLIVALTRDKAGLSRLSRFT